MGQEVGWGIEGQEFGIRNREFVTGLGFDSPYI
jgi:hypothetical protein